MNLAYLPSPPSMYLNVGPLMIHWYAIMVILGVAAAVFIGRRRWAAVGGNPDTVLDLAMVMVPFGIIGGRLYHVITSWQLYFGPGRHPIQALYVWDGGLGVWGAIAGGALGAWIATRRRGIAFPAFADAMAPAVLVGQAIGRIGCWFNQELYGRPTTLPWGLKIDPMYRPAATPNAATYHPTFAYEALWDLGAAGLVVWAQRRFRLEGGRVFALYVAAYTAGRGWIEALRVDPANHILGLRLNIWTSLLLFTAAVVYLYLRRPGRTREPAETAARDAATPEAAKPAAPRSRPSPGPGSGAAGTAHEGRPGDDAPAKAPPGDTAVAAAPTLPPAGGRR